MPARITRRRDGLVQLRPARLVSRIRLSWRGVRPIVSAAAVVVLGAVSPALAFQAITMAVVLWELGKLRREQQEARLQLAAERPRLAVVPGRPERR